MSTTTEKLDAILASLDDDERAQLAEVGPDTGRDELPEKLRARLEASVSDLTIEEKAQIIEMGTAVRSGDEVEGFTYAWVTTQPWNSANPDQWGSDVRDHREGSVPYGANDHRPNDAQRLINSLMSLF